MSDETETGTPTESVVRRAAHRSRLGALWRRTAAAVRGSSLYRWLTAEPDPDVIVIDLRKTWTVGPVIRLLDAVLDRLLPPLEDSRTAATIRAVTASTLAAPAVVGGLAVLGVGLLLVLVSVATGTLGVTRLGLAAGLALAGAIATRERRNWAELRETRPVELLVAALEPPAPPDEAESNTAPNDRTRPTASAETDEPDSDSPEREREADRRAPAER
ncbi:hypothetical protein EXE46_14050 [Halorubrum sp. GN11_10-6_MGM]|uniref:hypothetical protein n=1 Tax=Halorubrum sp. GN11_10-6_MGM TaxID=2518112 RepID=UPI0010F50C83|nr:hypothetical protein [Halorubrum sp. GN11_10-6_MGM]TKX73467.1 hypothetical protein EXE46_14050 [Halorubrum sp. GN11_10-6_MGM]